jgi:hypothetical protein
VPPNVRRFALATLALALATGTAACRSRAGVGPAAADGQAGASGAASGPGGAGGAGNAGQPASDAAPSPDAGAEVGGPPSGFDPGSVGIRRLSDAEYSRTLQDLLGLTGLDPSLGTTFADRDYQGGTLDVFDNLAGDVAPSPTISEVRYLSYFQNAVVLVQQAFAVDALRARIVTCAPASVTDDACASAIVRAFGLRAWRRPLTDGEVKDLVALVRADLTAGEDFADAVQQAVVALLVSETFLYRIERDPPAPDVSVHALTSYELATRLSYLLWSTMPDDALLALAASDELQKSVVLAAQVTRMLADARADGLVRNFFGQWLNFRVLEGALLDRPTAWTVPLQASVAHEARLFVTDLVQGDQGIGALLTSDVSFVNGTLATLYGFPPPAAPDAFTRTVITTDQRKGFLGLAAFLAVESEGFPRSAAISGDLLCTSVPLPPPNHQPPASSGPTRSGFNMIQSNRTCGNCHLLFDPIGLGLENFDEIGRFRTTYTGDQIPIDATGALPDGTPFTGLLGLADLLGKDPRVVACARREALVYTLGRRLTDADADRLAAIDARWSAAGNTVRGLLAAIVVDDIFRYRRGEGQP